MMENVELSQYWELINYMVDVFKGKKRCIINLPILAHNIN